MSETTYRDIFYEYIEERLRAGGDPEYMVSLARIYSEDDEYHSLRDYAFQEWLRDTNFTCGKCKAHFEKRSGDDVEFYHDVLCRRCRKACKDD